MPLAKPLYHLHEPAARSLYADVKSRARAAGSLLPGTPGSLVKRAGTGQEYWYRSYCPVPRKRSEQFVGASGNQAEYDAMRERIEDSAWTAKQVASLQKLGLQIADKSVASVLVELHNRGTFDAGLVLTGTLAYLGWLNEYGALVAATRTHEVNLARSQVLKLANPASLASILQATQLPFLHAGGGPGGKPATWLQLAGAEGLRLEIFAPGAILGDTVAVPELAWHAQVVPFFGYLIENSRPAAILAGGHCIPIMLPEATRMVWHKLYSSTRRRQDPTKAERDLVQGATLAAIVVEQGGVLLRDSFRGAPGELRKAALSRLPRLERLLAEHPQARDEFRKLR